MGKFLLIEKWIYAELACLVITIFLCFYPFTVTCLPSIPNAKAENSSVTIGRLQALEQRQSDDGNVLKKMEEIQRADHDTIMVIQGELKLLSSKIDNVNMYGTVIIGAMISLAVQRGISWISSLKKKTSEEA